MLQNKYFFLLLMLAAFFQSAQAQVNDETTKLDIWPEFEEPPYIDEKVKGHDFKVILNGLPDTNVILGFHQANKTFVKDTVRTDAKGVAHFVGKAAFDGGIYLIAVNNASIFEFVYSATEKDFTLETDLEDPLNNMEIKNSPENELFYEYQRTRIKYGKIGQQLNKRYQKHKEANNKDSMKVLEELLKENGEKLNEYQMNIAENKSETMTGIIINLMREPEVPDAPETAEDPDLWRYLYYKKHFWDYVDFSDDRILRNPIFRNKVNKFIGKQLTVQIPDSICATALNLIDECRESNKEVYKNVLTWITSKYEKSNIMGMNKVVCCLAQKYYLNDPECDWLSKKQFNKFKDHVSKECNVVIGKTAQELVLRDPNGQPRSLLAIEKPYTLIYFWSSTCGHCKKTTPKIKKLYQDYKDKGLEVYAVNTDYKEIKDENKKVIDLVESPDYLKYIKDKELDWINVADPLHQSKFRDKYNIYSTPVIYLIDENKEFIGVRLDHITTRRILMHEIDDMPHDEIDTWLKENGYVEEEEEGDEEETEE